MVINKAKTRVVERQHVLTDIKKLKIHPGKFITLQINHENVDINLCGRYLDSSVIKIQYFAMYVLNYS